MELFADGDGDADGGDGVGWEGEGVGPGLGGAGDVAAGLVEFALLWRLEGEICFLGGVETAF